MRRRVMEEDDPWRLSRHLAPVKPQTTCAIHEAIQGLNNNEDSFQLWRTIDTFAGYFLVK